jgi:serine/threonine protein kinase
VLAGQEIAGRYQIEESIGSGGMGTIYRARDLESGARVAIKVLQGEGWELRLEMEALVLAELRHPRIVRYVGHGIAESGSPFLAMQWLEGEDLAHRLDVGGGLSEEESIRVAVHVAEALEAGHARGVLHRDVKPSNVFLVEGDVDKVVLIDYGLARRTKGGRRITQTGSVLGTPEYMAPEQARGEPDVDARVDVYALGCVLFECLTGRTPFAAEHTIAVLGKILLETAPRLRSLRPDLPEDLDELVARMLSKNRAERPRDGEDALAQLRALAPTRSSATRLRSVPPLAITHGEQRLMSVIFARSPVWPDEPLLDALHAQVV